MQAESAQKRLSVLFAASCRGAPDPRCDAGPVQVAHQLAAATELPLDLLPVLHPNGDLPDFFNRLADQVAAQHQRLVVISGDHSCALGTWRGMVRRHTPLGLIWVDAHMDAHTPQTSPSGRLHGMPVAGLLGRGDPVYLPEGGVIRPANLCLVGVRSFEPPEAALLAELGVRVFSQTDVQRLGLAAVMKQARAIAGQGTLGYGLSLDLDGLDPLDAPAVGSPVVGGIAAADFLSELAQLCQDPEFLALEIAEFNPVNDVAQRTSALIMEMVTLMSGGGDESHD